MHSEKEYPIHPVPSGTGNFRLASLPTNGICGLGACRPYRDGCFGVLPSPEFMVFLVFSGREHLTIWLKCTVIFFVAYVAPAAVNFFAFKHSKIYANFAPPWRSLRLNKINHIFRDSSLR